MERRRFLKYTSLTATGLVFAACNSSNSGKKSASDSSSPKPGHDFGTLEKTDLTIGIIPVSESAPLVIAKEKGFFQRYGINVNLSKQLDWQAVQDGLIAGKLDASQGLFGMPMLAKLGGAKADMVSLMVLNLNGGGITLSQKAWDGGIRAGIEYLNFPEFADAYRKYIKAFEEKAKLAVDFTVSMNNYNYRYWLAAMGINPNKDAEVIEIPPSQMVHKIKAGFIDGYCVSEPWNQQAIYEKTGFSSYITPTIWKGHPGNILATMEPWVKENPVTARALVAAVLEACQFCDRPENRPEVVQILAQSKYLNTDAKPVGASLDGTYNYGGFDNKNRVKSIPDFYLFNFRDTNYLKPPNHANYPWRSHGVWLLTQMIRWNHLDLQEYPKDADKIIDKTYPLEIYADVAQALKIKLPSDRMKIEPAEVFIDGRKFDPSQPVEYLSSFDIRA